MFVCLFFSICWNTNIKPSRLLPNAGKRKDTVRRNYVSYMASSTQLAHKRATGSPPHNAIMIRVSSSDDIYDSGSSQEFPFNEPRFGLVLHI